MYRGAVSSYQLPGDYVPLDNIDELAQRFHYVVACQVKI